MKQKNLLKTILLLCALVVGSGTMWGQATTYTTGTNITWTHSNGVVIGGTTYDACKIAKGSSTSITIPAGTTKLYVHCAAWNGESANLSISSTTTGVSISPTTWGITADSGISGNSTNFTLNTQNNASTSYYKEFTVSGASSAATIKFSCANNKRAVIWGINAESKTATTVTLDPTSLTFNLADGVTKSLSATVKAGNITLNNADVTWSVSQGSDYASVTNTGVVSALAAGTAKIKATYAGDNTYASSYAECTVTVNKANTAVTITAVEGTIDLKPANKADINLRAGVKAIKSDESMVDLDNPSITWSVQSGSDYVDVSNTGVVSGKAVGTATIRASYAGGDLYNASYLDCQITVTDTRTPVNMSSFSATTNPIVVGNTTVTAVTTDNENWTPAYTYSSTNTGVATIAADGTITANAKGTATIRATLNIPANDANYKPGTTTFKEFDLTVTNPFYTATFSVNSDETRTASVEQGQPITFPTAVETTPGEGEFPKVINQKIFKGWVTSAIATPTNTAPTFIDTDNTNMGGANITYYAVYAKETQVESDNVNDATLAQTLQHGSWTPTGDTDSKTEYTLFGNGAYVESAAFDLSKLMKVKVYGGTYGGSDIYKYGTITDGTNKWLDFELTGTGNTKEHSFTGGSALTGTKALRIASTCGNGSGSGLRMSKIEIFVKGVNTTYSKYSTTVSMLPIPEITMADVQMTWGATDKSVAPTATISGEAYQGSFTYESSSANLTVASDGKLTCNVPGSYKVTTRIAGSDNYQEAEKECNVIVTKQDITIAFPNNNADVDRIISNTASDNKFSQAATVAPTAYDGTVTYAISGDTNGASITGTEVTYTKSGTITVTATAPATEKYNGNSASYDLHIYYADIAQVKALTSSSTEVTFAANLTDAVVTYVKDDYAYLQDNTAAVMVNFANHGLTAGKKINGKVTGKVKASNQIDALTALDITEATTSDAEAPAATVLTLAQIKSAGTLYDGKLVTVNGGTITGSMATTDNSGASIKDGSQIESTDVSFTLYAPNKGVAITASEKGNFTGFVSIYNGSTYRLNLYEPSQFVKTHNAPVAQTLSFTEDAVELDEESDAYNNFAGQTVNGAVGTVTYSIDSNADGVVTSINSETGAVVLSGAYGTATIKAAAAATETTDGSVTTPYTAASKTYTVTVYPLYTSTFSINGDVTVVRQATHGASIALPTPAATMGDYSFVGWTESTINGSTDNQPTMVTPPTTPTSNVTYYAVYAIGTGTPVVEHTSTFTVQQASAPSTSPFVSDGSSWTWSNVNFSSDTDAHMPAGSTIAFSLPTGGKAVSLVINSTDNHTWAGADKLSVNLTDNLNNNIKTFNVNSLSYDFTSTYDQATTYTLTAASENTKNAWISTIVFEYTTGGISYSGYCTSIPETLTISINAACNDGNGNFYGTFYTDKAYVMNDMLEGQVVKVDNNGKLTVQTAYESGDVVPAETALLIYAVEAGDYTVNVTTEDGLDWSSDNMLKGTLAANETTVGENCLFYRLTMHNGTQIGFYWGAADGGAFQPGANKAYLAVPKTISARMGFSLFGDDETGIANANLDGDVNLNGVYNLQGQRVDNPKKGGLYIVNGRKQIMR